MPLLIGLDIGTTGVKGILINEKGNILGSASSEYALYTPKPLWSEQNPLDWWNGTKDVIKKLIHSLRMSPKNIVGIGLTGQMHGAVFLDHKGEIIRHAILWNDQRTYKECEEILQKIGINRLLEIAGNPALTGFQAPKILWLRNHEPQNYEKVWKILLPKDYVRFRLSGALASDVADASGTLLLDLRTRDWSEEILDKLSISKEWLPLVFEGTQVTGKLSKVISDELGLPEGIPIVAGGGDNAAAGVGTGIIQSGIVSSSIGTSGVLFAHCEDIKIDKLGRLHTFCHSVPYKYHIMAVTLSAGGSLRWFRDILIQVINSIMDFPINIEYNKLAEIAAKAPPGSEGLFFLPYLNGERTPHLDPFARGVFFGLSTRHSICHLIRAIMEGVVYSLKDGLEVMKKLGMEIQQVRATGGGSKSAFWRQLQADIYETDIIRLKGEEGPAYGAAILAGVGTKIFEDIPQAVQNCVQIESVTHPNPQNIEIYHQGYKIYREIYPQIQELMHKDYFTKIIA